MPRRMGWVLCAIALIGSSGCGLLCDRYCDRFHDRCDHYYRDRGCGCAPQPTGCYAPPASNCYPSPGYYTPQPANPCP